MYLHFVLYKYENLKAKYLIFNYYKTRLLFIKMNIFVSKYGMHVLSNYITHSLDGFKDTCLPRWFPQTLEGV